MTSEGDAKPSSRGRFITIEGGDGSGKSTQLRRLGAFLRDRGFNTVETREPGGSTGAEALRGLLLDPKYTDWPPMSEALMVFSARCDHVENLIKPALARGDWVLCDRFVDSTMAYQGVAQGLGTELIETLRTVSLGDMVPDLTLIFDLDPEIGLSRTIARGEAATRYELMDGDFHAVLRQAFLDCAARAPERYSIIDASQDEGEVSKAVEAAVSAHFGLS